MKNANTRKRNDGPGKMKKKRRVGRIIRNIILIVVIVLAALFGLANLLLYRSCGETIFSCARYAKQIVSQSTEDTFRPNATSFIYSADGTEIAKLYEDTDSTYLEYDEIPKDVINAFIAVEDRTYWTNSGIDLKGIMRVSLNYLRTGGDVAQGASTITQQLSRDIFLTNEKSMERKVKEIFIALNLTKKYSKEQLMEYYCNNVCFANGIYGIEDASQTYFNKPASELDLSEAAYLCSIPNRPEYYNPFKDSSTALTRRNKILEDMYECNYITAEERDAAIKEQINVAEEDTDSEFYNYETSYAINCAAEYLMKELYDFDFKYHFDTEEEYNEYHEQYDNVYQDARRALYTGGYTIQTTIDLKAQQDLQDILDEHLAFSTKIKDDGVFNLQGAMTVIDNETGKVVAVIGGREQDELSHTLSFNRAYQDYQQPGSSIKPLLVYTPALMKGFSSSSTLKDINVSAAKTSKSVSSMSGSPISLRSAVIRSRNGAAYWTYNEISPSYGMSFLESLEFSHLHPNDYVSLSPSLGGFTYGTNTTEMANAYNTLYNHGQYTKTDCLTSIKDKKGNELYHDSDSKTVYSASAADEMVSILKGVLSDPSGTAHALNWSSLTGTEAAGKTGTTNDNRDGWFCGITPYYTISVWVGSDDNTTVNGLSGSSYPAQIWKDAMYYMVKDLPDKSFDLSVSSSSSSWTPSDSDTDSQDTEETEQPTQEPETPDTTEQPTQEPGTQNTTEQPAQEPDEPDTDSEEPDDITGTITPEEPDEDSDNSPSVPETPSGGSDSSDSTSESPSQDSGNNGSNQQNGGNTSGTPEP